jgi:wyosine [tRNA(Phe)-imidazoG37] synthetase (radical SAM superfamily)
MMNTRLKTIIKKIIPAKLYRNILYPYLVLRPRYRRRLPSGITIELTDVCNIACSYCPKSLGIGTQGGHMDFALFTIIMDEACSLLPLKQVVLTGFGEPLLYPRLEEAIAYIKNKNPSIRVIFTTNGILLTPERTKRILAAGLDQLTISLNAVSREQYKEFTKFDYYEQIVNNTRALLALVNEGRYNTKVYVQVMAGLNTEKDIEAFKTCWQPYLGECAQVQVQPFVNWGGMIKPVASKPIKKVKYPCIHLYNNWIISREGEALACCMVFPAQQGDLKLGNIKNKSLSELYLSGRIKKLQKMNQKGLLYALTPCKDCDAFLTVPNIWIRNPLYKLCGKKYV